MALRGTAPKMQLEHGTPSASGLDGYGLTERYVEIACEKLTFKGTSKKQW